MTHPEDLLADYVDGTLGDDERAVVDVHLRGCAVCREEIGLSRAAAHALSTLEDVPVPLGVTGPVLAEAGRRFERRREVFWKRMQWVAGAAAAAAIVAVVAVGLGVPGSDDEGGDRAGAGATAAEEAPAAEQDGAGEAATVAGQAVMLEDQRDVNYDEGGVRSLADEAAERAESQEAIGAPDGREGLVGPGPALECLRASGAPVDEPTDTLVRVIQARYLGTPAYFAVFLESPGAGRPPDTVVVWVAARDECERILATASRPIQP